MVCKFNHYTASISSVKMGIMVLLSAWIDQCSPMNKHKKTTCPGYSCCGNLFSLSFNNQDQE